jgi:hypothetical protein
MVAEAAQARGGRRVLVNGGSAPRGSDTATDPIEFVDDGDLLEDFNIRHVVPVN